VGVAGVVGRLAANVVLYRIKKKNKQINQNEVKDIFDNSGLKATLTLF